MLNLCGIVTAILKMVTARNFSMSGINSGHHNLPTSLLVIGTIRTIGSAKKFVRITSGFDGGE